MVKVNIIRSIVVTAAVLSMMAVTAGPAQAAGGGDRSSCSQQGGGGDNNVSCQDGIINININNTEILNDAEVDILENGIDAYVLNDSLNCNSIITVASATCAKGLIAVIVDVHKLIGVELKWVIVKVGTWTEKKYCPC